MVLIKVAPMDVNNKVIERFCRVPPQKFLDMVCDPLTAEVARSPGSIYNCAFHFPAYFLAISDSKRMNPIIVLVIFLLLSSVNGSIICIEEECNKGCIDEECGYGNI